MITLTKEDFYLNYDNKQYFIKMIANNNITNITKTNININDDIFEIDLDNNNISNASYFTLSFLDKESDTLTKIYDIDKNVYYLKESSMILKLKSISQDKTLKAHVVQRLKHE